MLNEKQQKVWDYVSRFVRHNGFPPSVREVCSAFGFSSPRSGQKYLEALEKEGLIKRENTSRGIKLLSGSPFDCVTLPFLGYIAAGAPIEVVEPASPAGGRKEEMEVPKSLVSRKPCYILQVKGNSMIEDHILDGDFIVVEKCETADNGEVVVALINREAATLKRLYREKTRVRLEPANSALKPIYVKDVAVQGKVRGLFRRF